MNTKHRVVLTCWDYMNPTPYADNLSGFFDTVSEANAAIEKAVADELETLNAGRETEDFRADDCSDHDNIIRFWDGDDYQEVTAYNMHLLYLNGNSIEESTRIGYRGAVIESNPNHTRFVLTRDGELTARTLSLEKALDLVDADCLLQQRVMGKGLSFNTLLRAAEEKAGKQPIMTNHKKSDIAR